MAMVPKEFNVRWRRADTEGGWRYMTVPSGTGNIKIPDVEPGIDYIINVQCVPETGRPSEWLEFAHTALGLQKAPPIPQNPSATGAADHISIQYEFDADLIVAGDVQIEVWVAPDVAGAAGTYAWLDTIRATNYKHTVTDGAKRWYKLRSINTQKLTSSYSTEVSATPKTSADGADVTPSQVIADATDWATSRDALIAGGYYRVNGGRHLDFPPDLFVDDSGETFVDDAGEDVAARPQSHVGDWRPETPNAPVVILGENIYRQDGASVTPAQVITSEGTSLNTVNVGNHTAAQIEADADVVESLTGSGAVTPAAGSNPAQVNIVGPPASPAINVQQNTISSTLSVDYSNYAE